MRLKINKNSQTIIGLILFTLVLIGLSGTATAFDIWGTYDGQAPTDTTTTPTNTTETYYTADGQAPTDTTTTETSYTTDEQTTPEEPTTITTKKGHKITKIQKVPKITKQKK